MDGMQSFYDSASRTLDSFHSSINQKSAKTPEQDITATDANEQVRVRMDQKFSLIDITVSEDNDIDHDDLADAICDAYNACRQRVAQEMIAQDHLTIDQIIQDGGQI